MVKITVGIDGMACGMCEAHINEAVRNAFPVKKVTSSHTRKETVILVEREIPEPELSKVIAKAGYDVMSVNWAPYEKGTGQGDDCAGACLRYGAFVGAACRKREATGGDGFFGRDDMAGKSKNAQFRLHFSVQDATSLPYAEETFDAAVISNALHIMPEPEKALAEIRRVLKPGGILIAPTFTASGSISGRMRIWFMELSGFKVFHKWTPQEYLDFLKENGFEITGRKIFDGTLKLTYVEAVRGQG